MSESRKWTKRLGRLLQLALSVGLLAWVVSRAGAGDVWADLAGLDPALYVLAAAFFLLGLFLRSLRWRIILRDLDVDASLGALLSIYTIGVFFDNLLPTGIGGDVVRALELGRESQRGTAALSSVVANRLVGMFTMSGLGLVALLLNPGIFPAIVTWAVAALVVGIVLGVWLVRRDVLTWLSARLPFTRALTQHPKVQELHATATTYSSRTLLLALGVSILFTASLVLTQFTIALALDVHLGINYFAVAAPVIGAVTMLPISFNGLGLREGVYTYLFTSVGVASSVAVAMSLAFYGLRIGVGLIGGALLLTSSARRLAVREGSRADG